MARSWLSRFVAAVALAAFGIALFFRGEAPTPRAPPTEPAAPEDPAPPPEEIVPTPSEDEAWAPEPHASEPRPASAPPTPGSIDPCADDEVDAAIERPSLGTLVHDRISELNDRMVAAMRRPTSSAALREGLRLGTRADTGDEALRRLSSAPDRVEDGFDFAVAVRVALAAEARNAGEHRRARTLLDLAARSSPDDPLALAFLALEEDALGDAAAATDALARAHTIDPSEPSIALALARHLRDGADPAAAVAAFDAYLAEVPDDAMMRRRRERLARRASAVAGYRVTTRGALSMLAPTSTDAHAIGSALDTLDAALTRAARLLGVDRPRALTVIAYGSEEAMRTATCAQSWTGALYDGTLHVPVADLASEIGRTSLQHESLHAVLHTALPMAVVPTWLDEGIAQYFAPEAGAERSFRLMVGEHAVIPFESIDGSFMVIDDPTDARLAYHQAYGMVLWLVDVRGERGIAEAVGYLEGGGDPTRVLAGVTHQTPTPDLLRAFLERHLGSH